MPYRLADGTWSNEYKSGDKFVVDDYYSFSKGAIVSFYEDDNTHEPLFKLERGSCGFENCDGEGGAYTPWKVLKKYDPKFLKAQKQEELKQAQALVAKLTKELTLIK